MNEIQAQKLIIKAVLIGVGATMIMDIRVLFLKFFLESHPLTMQWLDVG
ncbi:hypothetical protein [Desulfobacter curvatus]|nr:hypothetical protein [Desulfobacter curvatus]